MKKFISVFITVCLMLCCISGGVAEGINDFEGVWYAQSLSQNGETFLAGDIGIVITFDFAPDGSLTYNNGVSADKKGSWTAEENDIFVVLDDETIQGNLKDGVLTMDDPDSGISVSFSRNAVEKLTVGNEVPVSDISEFNGNWVCNVFNIDGELVRASLLGNGVSYLSVSDGTVRLGGSDILDIADDDSLDMELVDGKLIRDIEASDLSSVRFTLSKIDDGSIAFYMIMEDSQIGMYFSPITAPASEVLEAAEESVEEEHTGND